MPKLAIRNKEWWHDIREHPYTVGIWVFLGLMDGALTQYGLVYGGLPYGGRESNPFIYSLTTPLFMLQKIVLMIAVVIWLSLWRWVRYLKWLNWLFVVVVCLNIVELIKPGLQTVIFNAIFS